MPQITKEVLLRTMSADYAEVKRRSEAVAALLTAGSEVRIISSEGTDLTLSLEGRKGLADTGDLHAPGAFGNLPAGEGFVAPAEGVSQGVVVFDGTIAGIEKLQSPLTVRIEDGYATSIKGEQASELRALLEPYGRDAHAVAELGIGTNEAARLSGNLLEDEKIMGTIHVALGDNHSFGGSIRVASHIDGVVLRPTLTVDSEILVENGRLSV
jgi:leucyl aminopeptidase (aminopeptidase T)